MGNLDAQRDWGHTIEHYPGRHDFEILDFRSAKIIVNRDEAGCLQVYDNPVFHGREGTTLEMRVFCETDALSRIARSGFENIHVCDQPQLSIGYYWPEISSPYPHAPSHIHNQCPSAGH
jgi:hypothetical protein